LALVVIFRASATGMLQLSLQGRIHNDPKKQYQRIKVPVKTRIKHLSPAALLQ